MSILRRIGRGLRALFHRDADDQNTADEVEHYLALAAAAHERRGLSPDEARRAARLEMGNPTTTRERVREYGWENVVEAGAADVRYALRRLRGSPGFTLVAVLTLALGIGATTAIFSAVEPILIEPLPYPGADRLVVVSDAGNNGLPVASTFGEYEEIRARSRSFESIAITDAWCPSLTGVDEPERLVGERVSANYFHTLGVSPAAGRSFLAAEDQPGAERAAILSDRLVQRRFAGDRSLVGRRILLDDVPYTVVGIMPRGFANVANPSVDIWSTLAAQPHAAFQSREWGHHYQIVGRLAPNLTHDRARLELANIGRTPTPEFARPAWADLANGVFVLSLKDSVTHDAKPALFAIAGAVLLLLVIACVNVANLLAARSAQRGGELGMRVALGAGRGRLLQQMLTESLVLATVGGVAGVGIAWAGIRALVAVSPPGLPRVDAIGLHAPVLGFAVAVTTLVGLAAGFIPALTAVRTGLRDGLRQGSRRTTTIAGRGRQILVVAEVALALVLLVNAGLLMRSLERLFSVEPGFDGGGTLTMQVITAGGAYRSDDARRQFYDQALDAVRRVPGVTAAAFTSQLPLTADLDGYGYATESKPDVAPGTDGSALRYAVSPGYFEAMGIPLLRGRLLDATDAPGRPTSVVISQSLARNVFGNADPIGQRMRFGPQTSGDAWDVVVGVVGNVKQVSLDASQTDAFYVTTGQWAWVDNAQSFVVRASGDPVALVPSLKQAVWSAGSRQPIQRIVMMEDLIAATGSSRRFTLTIIQTFAACALMLATIGLYGVIAGGVSERVREIGIRSALGATARDVVAGVVGRAMVLAVAGVAIGLAGAAAASRVLESMLFGVSRGDPATYIGVTVLLAIVAALASWAPARRAARIDPAITLRAE
jgi:putative ABC transport system permease protein